MNILKQYFKKGLIKIVVFILLIVIAISCSKAFDEFNPYENTGYFYLKAMVNGENKEFKANAKRERDERNISLTISVIEFYQQDGLEIFVEKYSNSEDYANAPDSVIFTDSAVIFVYALYNGLNDRIDYTSTNGELFIIEDNDKFIEGEFNFIAYPDSARSEEVEMDSLNVTYGYFKISFAEGY